jgi:hypothetical protein
MIIRDARTSKIADALSKSGCSTHRASCLELTIMTDFIAAILELENNMVLAAIVGH